MTEMNFSYENNFIKFYLIYGIDRPFSIQYIETKYSDHVYR